MYERLQRKLQDTDWIDSEEWIDPSDENPETD